MCDTALFHVHCDYSFTVFRRRPRRFIVSNGCETSIAAYLVRFSPVCSPAPTPRPARVPETVRAPPPGGTD